MSLVTDLRDILDDGPPLWDDAHDEWYCVYCTARVLDRSEDDDVTIYAAFQHESDCPWLSMPKIVAVLEIVDLMFERYRDPAYAGTLADTMDDLEAAFKDGAAV